LIIFDIDFFKKINDSHGHQTGDEILKSITKIIKNEIRETDLLARFGGDEFLIISPETNIKNGKIIAEKIRESVEDKELHNNIKTTISLGITEYKDKDTIDSLMKRTDNALYQSKSRGRNNCSIL
jgi:diguanylate cyclase (GGDEF)-like protein